MHDVRRAVRRAGTSDSIVLIRGETGTGKEVVARAIHAESPRSGQPFTKTHCAALPDGLLESELFGYEKGAFTGAAAAKPGRVELAAGGTLFIDEIGDVSPAVQVKLLRVVEDREYERLGGTSTLRADVRFVFATHRRLESMVERGEFREDLFYRIDVLPIWIPPLRARRDDIVYLALHFAECAAKKAGRPVPRFTDEALAMLRRERWPGNARQLRNVVERVVAFGTREAVGGSEIECALAPAPEFVTEEVGESPWLQQERKELTHSRLEAERDAIRRALDDCAHNRTQAARMLGISRRTLYNKLEQLRLDRPSRDERPPARDIRAWLEARARRTP
jgi:two-component system response regulator AtoC